MNFDASKPVTHVEARNGSLARVGDYVYVSDSLYIALVDRIYFQKSGSKKNENDSDGVWMFTGKWVYRMQDFPSEELRKMLGGRETAEREVFLSLDTCTNSVARIVGTCVVRPSIGGPQRGRAWPNHFYYRGLIKKDGTYVDLLPENKELLKGVFGPDVDYSTIFKKSSYTKRFLKRLEKERKKEVKESSEDEENNEENEEEEEENNEENEEEEEEEEGEGEGENEENDMNEEEEEEENEMIEKETPQEEIETERIEEDVDLIFDVDINDIKTYIIERDEVMQVNEDSDDDNTNEGNEKDDIPIITNQEQVDTENEEGEEEEEKTMKKEKQKTPDTPTKILTRSQAKALAPPKKKSKLETKERKTEANEGAITNNESAESFEHNDEEEEREGGAAKKEEPKKTPSKHGRKRKETPDEREKRSAHTREMNEKRKLIEFRWIGYGREYSPTLTSYPSGFARYSTIYRNGEHVFFTATKGKNAPRDIGRIALLYDINETETHMARIELYISRVEQLPPRMRNHKYESLFAKGEVFLTTTVLDVPISQILTKCRVAQIAEVGNVVTWSSKQDHFWWCRWYDEENEELSESIPPRNKTPPK